MSHCGKLAFVCLLLGAACELFQIGWPKEVQAAPATIQNGFANEPEGLAQGLTMTVPPAGKQPCLVVPLSDAARFCGGLRNPRGKARLNVGELNQVLLSLREKTGWQSLRFDEEGFLVCPDPHLFSGGSAAARRLLGKAIFSNETYYLEAHNRSQAVAFARLIPGTDYLDHGTGARINTSPVQIDFSDFTQLRGQRTALKAFDVGLAILHELAHGVWHLRDAESEEEEPGECEAFINQIRRDLYLPERQHYLARVRLCTVNCKRMIAELRFTRTLAKQGQARRKRFVLQWEAETVGAITNFSVASVPTPRDVRNRESALAVR